jgi:hypothetical protein
MRGMLAAALTARSNARSADSNSSKIKKKPDQTHILMPENRS